MCVYIVYVYTNMCICTWRERDWRRRACSSRVLFMPFFERLKCAWIACVWYTYIYIFKHMCVVIINNMRYIHNIFNAIEQPLCARVRVWHINIFKTWTHPSNKHGSQIHVYKYTHTHPYTYTHKHTYTYYTYTYTHIHTHK